MVTEDYVSFETAKLLKEKGFRENCIATYNLVTKNFEIEEAYQDWTTRWKAYVSAPTFQMTMKWLREVHNLAITRFLTRDGWCSGVSRIKFNSLGFIVDIIDGIDDGNIPKCDTHEEACEAAIRYCLENLI